MKVPVGGRGERLAEGLAGIEAEAVVERAKMAGIEAGRSGAPHVAEGHLRVGGGLLMPAA